MAERLHVVRLCPQAQRRTRRSNRRQLADATTESGLNISATFAKIYGERFIKSGLLDSFCSK
jgi:hypothetical protein